MCFEADKSRPFHCLHLKLLDKVADLVLSMYEQYQVLTANRVALSAKGNCHVQRNVAILALEVGSLTAYVRHPF